jgi:hypothetical protein
MLNQVEAKVEGGSRGRHRKEPGTRIGGDATKLEPPTPQMPRGTPVDRRRAATGSDDALGAKGLEVGRAETEEAAVDLRIVGAERGSGLI